MFTVCLQAGETSIIQATKRTVNRPEDTTMLDLANADATVTQQQPVAVAHKFGPKDPAMVTGQKNNPTGWPPKGTQNPKETLARPAKVTPTAVLKPDRNYRGSSLALSFDGLDAYTTRYLVDGGNRDNGEPANPSLAVGLAYVVQTTTSAFRVYNRATGRPLMPPLSLNTFFGLPYEKGTTEESFSGPYGPVVSHAQVQYDTEAQRWFVAAATTERDVWSGATIGSSLDLAVSDTSNPTGESKQCQAPIMPCKLTVWG